MAGARVPVQDGPALFRRRIMAIKSDESRRKAFEHLKLAKLSRSLDERRGHRTIARSYEAIAETERWLESAAKRRPALPPKLPGSEA